MPAYAVGEHEMNERQLNAAQVACLLVSTTCGIGFVLGTAEIAVHSGFLGCLYPVATTLGLLLLAMCARPLWASRKSLWDWFEHIYGPPVGRSVALLSFVWMTGVLAAQIRGGSAILAMTGLSPLSSMLMIACLLTGLSAIQLSSLSSALAFCMLLCNAALFYCLIRSGTVGIWLHAPLQFLHALHSSPPGRTAVTGLSVAVMVVCGADYQQFLIAGRSPRASTLACLLAAGAVFAIGFLPASAIVATSSTLNLANINDPAAAIPIVLVHAFTDDSANGVRSLVLAVLVTTALGAGSAVLRAMSSAAIALTPNHSATGFISRAVPVILASLVASCGQTIIDMMVDLNIVYMVATGPLIVLSLLNIRLSPHAATLVIVEGFCIAVVEYLLHLTGVVTAPGAIAGIFLTAFPLGFIVTARTRFNGCSLITGRITDRQNSKIRAISQGMHRNPHKRSDKPEVD